MPKSGSAPPLKIVLNLKLLGDSPMGAGQYAREIARRVPMLDTKNAFVYLARSAKTAREMSELPRTETIAPRPYLSSKWGLIGWELALLPGTLRKIRPDVTLFPEPVVPLLPYPGRSVVTVHDLVFAEAGDSLPAGKRFYKRWSLVRALKRADHVVTVSRYTAGALSRLFHVPSEKISVVHNGVDLTQFHPRRDGGAIGELRARFGLGGGPFLLYVGYVLPRKNVDVLIAAFLKIRRAGPADLRLVIAGERPERGASQAATQDPTAAGEGVHHIGYVTREELALLYSHAAMLVYPSTYEGFGLPPLEAMACGCPVISTAYTALPEVIGEAGVLLEDVTPDAVARAITDLMEDERKRQELSERGIRRAAQFTWDRAARETLNILQRVARG